MIVLLHIGHLFIQDTFVLYRLSSTVSGNATEICTIQIVFDKSFLQSSLFSAILICRSQNRAVIGCRSYSIVIPTLCSEVSYSFVIENIEMLRNAL